MTHSNETETETAAVEEAAPQFTIIDLDPKNEHLADVEAIFRPYGKFS